MSLSLSLNAAFLMGGQINLFKIGKVKNVLLFQFLPEMLAVNVGNCREILGKVIKITEAGHHVRIEQDCPPVFVLITFLDRFEAGDLEKVFLQNLPHRAHLCSAMLNHQSEGFNVKIEQLEVSTDPSMGCIVTIDQSGLTCSRFTESLGMRAVVLKSSGCHSEMPLTSRGGSMGDIILFLVVTKNALLMLLNSLGPPVVIT